MHGLIPNSVVYLGLVGCAIALVVATAQNNWDKRVFFLLLLRLAIGWHFLFEGLYKINTHLVGKSDTNRVFTSEPYFGVSPTGLGAMMRKKFSDPQAIIDARVKPQSPIENFSTLGRAEQAAACPPAVAKEFDELLESITAVVKKEGETEKLDAPKNRDKAVKAAEVERDLAIAVAESDLAARIQTLNLMGTEMSAVKDDKAREAVQKLIEDRKKDAASVVTEAKTKADLEAVKKTKAANDAFPKKLAEAEDKLARPAEIAADRIEAAKVFYAGWVYGVQGRNTKVKFASGDAALTAPQRLEHLDWLRKELASAEAVVSSGVGNGNGVQVKYAAELRADLLAAESDLARDASAAEIKKEILGKDVPEVKVESEGRTMDRFTMWFIAGVGACILFGFCTRISCVLGAGFLFVTYLTHPPFPGYVLPPMTEGNPLYVNKNAIEALALLALACYPSGRWLGLDAFFGTILPDRSPAVRKV